MSSETAGCLYIIGTPIGNLEDATPRSKRLLGEVDILAAEDTRTAKHLLEQFEIAAPTILSYFEGNEASRTPQLLDAMRAGKSVGLISEAGMPSVSDPGQRLVEAAGAAGIVVVPVPGPSAVISAVVGSGLPTDRFTFVGFLPRERGPRRRALGELRARPETLIFYESPERASACLDDMADAFGSNRPAVLARELTKMYEEFVRGTCESLAKTYAVKSPRGECTIVVGGALEGHDAPIDVEGAVRELLEEGLGPKDIASRLMVKTGKPRRELYQLALSLQRER